ncbi:MAG TPA: SLC13 family permease [Chitinophagales bacterium]|nr:SLC13 family permease [Chitinophagales bacterium]
MEIAIVIGLLIVAVALFATEKFSVDVITFITLIILVLTGIISSGEAFAAFSSDFVIMLAAIFVITSSIESSGVMDVLSDYISKTRAAKLLGVLIWMMPFAALLSAFINNTTLTALLLPPLLSIARKSSITPSKLLMPMAFAGMVGGTCTLIGTSTNIAVSGYLAKEGYGQLGIFDITPIGLSLLGVFILYMLTAGRWLLPEHAPGPLEENYKMREYMSEVKILPGSSLIGQRVYSSSLANSGFRILGIIRDNHKFYPGWNSVFQENDLVLVNGNVKDLLAVKEKSGIEIAADTLDVFYGGDKKDPMQLSEVLIPANSGLAGKTIKAIDFRNRYGLVVVAVKRAGTSLTQKIGSIRLQVGDMLLVQGTPQKLADFHDQHNLILLDEHKINPLRARKGLVAILLFLAAVIMGTLKIIPLDIAFLSAAIGAGVLRIVKAEEAYSNINWRLLVLISGMTAFGTAMKNSGADVFISNAFISVFERFGPQAVMLGFMLVTVLLTQPMSNAAAALVVLPVALKSAEALQVNPLTFGVAIMLSASISFITPFEPSCLLIYGPGKYKFLDFIKVGGFLTLLLLGVIFCLVPMVWPLR